MKKGSAFDFLYAGLFMFLAVLMTIIGSFAWGTFSDAWNNTAGVESGSKALVTRIDTNWYTTFDFGIASMFFLLWVTSVCLAYFLDNSSIFFVIFILLGIIMLVTLAVLGTFLTSLQDTAFGATIDKLPLTKFIINAWLAFLVFFLVSVGGALYAQNKLAGGQ